MMVSLISKILQKAHFVGADTEKRANICQQFDNTLITLQLMLLYKNTPFHSAAHAVGGRLRDGALQREVREARQLAEAAPDRLHLRRDVGGEAHLNVSLGQRFLKKTSNSLTAGEER